MRAIQIIALGLALKLAVGLLCAANGLSQQVQQPSGAITFSSHVAKIIHEHCAVCHHEGQSAPFNLLSYQDVRKRAKQILESVEKRTMPPWLAEHGYGEFSNERRLTTNELSLLRRWVADGTPEGDPKSTPPPPQWPSGWMQGTPDLIVTMEKPYELGPEGPDVYRNFVIPLPLDRDRLVRAVEFAPGNPRIVHHAFIRVDEEGLARKLDGKDGQPGFTNMLSKVRMPGGQTSDEMCELGVQTLAANANDLKILEQTVRGKLFEEELRSRIALNQNDAEALSQLGMILWGRNRGNEARDYLERAIRVQPNFAQGHYNKGVFLRMNGLSSEARRSFETVLRIDAGFAKAYQQLGFAFADLGQAVEAERNLAKAFEIDPSDPMTRDGLAEIRQFLKTRSK